MSNIKENYGDSVTLIGKTLRDNDNDSPALIIPKGFAKKVGIENSKVSMSLLDDLDGNKHIVLTKYYKEIVIE